MTNAMWMWDIEEPTARHEYVITVQPRPFFLCEACVRDNRANTSTSTPAIAHHEEDPGRITSKNKDLPPAYL